MAFIKQIISDRVVVGGQRYTMTTLGDGRVEIVPSPDSITTAGTPIDKDLLQRYEDFLEEVQNHLNNTSNPHGVTKNQVGLNNVPNVDATNATNITGGTLDVGRLPTEIPQANITGLVAALNAAAAHAANTSNPHGVTKGQVGLGSVTNDAQLKASDKVTSIGGSPTNDQIPSAAAVKSYADTKLTAAQLTGAISNILTTNLTQNRALISDGSGKIVASDITVAELNRLDGLTSNITTLLSGKLSNGTLIGTYTNNQTISKSALTGYKFLMFELKKLTTGYNGNFYGDSVITTPDIFYYFNQSGLPKRWVADVLSGGPFIVENTNVGMNNPTTYANWLNTNYPASSYAVGAKARNAYTESLPTQYVYAKVEDATPAITQNGGIRLMQYNGSTLTYATVVSISSTQIRLNCDTSYNMRVWGFN